MKSNFLTAIFILLGLFAQSQTINTWQGGYPSHENDWNTAANWSLREVPNQTHEVVIPDMGTDARHIPMLADATVEINSLKILPGAQLILKNGARISLPTSTVFAPIVKGYWDDKVGYISAATDHAKR
jgi:hypothetical protein